MMTKQMHGQMINNNYYWKGFLQFFSGNLFIKLSKLSHVSD